VEKPEIEDREIVALTVRQTARLLLTARNQTPFRPFLASIAIQLFAGLRTSEIRTLDWNASGDKQIIVLASKVNTRQRRTVSILYSATCLPRNGRMAPVAQGKGMAHGFTAWIRRQNHSLGRETPCVTVLAATTTRCTNQNLTAAEMGNSPEMIFKHYRRSVFDKDEKRYWNLANKETKVIPLQAALGDEVRCIAEGHDYNECFNMP